MRRAITRPMYALRRARGALRTMRRGVAVLAVIGLLFTAFESFLPDAHDEGRSDPNVAGAVLALDAHGSPTSSDSSHHSLPTGDTHAQHVDHCSHAHSAPPPVSAPAPWLELSRSAALTAYTPHRHSVDSTPHFRPPIA